MNRITLDDLANMLSSLPPEVRAKELCYLDLSTMEQVDLEDLRKRLINSDNPDIEECSN